MMVGGSNNEVMLVSLKLKVQPSGCSKYSLSGAKTPLAPQTFFLRLNQSESYPKARRANVCLFQMSNG